MDYKTLLINKKDLYKTKFKKETIPTLQPEEVLLRIEKYAFTANNITYAVFGDRLYWAFFPATQSEGVLPVWGFARVVASNHPSVQKGERFYGYYPTSALLKVKVGKWQAHGFVDVSSHRMTLPMIYNTYNKVKANPTNPELEDYLPFFKPLFGTAFLAYHSFKEKYFYGARQVILTSASSKTALSLAFILKQNKGTDNLHIIGLTSSKNIGFVQQSDFYDEVYTYDDYKSIKKFPSLLVDFGGNVELLQSIATYFEEAMQFMSLIGFTDWQEASLFQHERAKMFFAPSEMEKLVKEWGEAKLGKRINQVMFEFIEQAKVWLELEMIPNTKIKQLYLDLLDGKMDPRKAYLVV